MSSLPHEAAAVSASRLFRPRGCFGLAAEPGRGITCLGAGNLGRPENIELVQRSAVVTERGREGYMLAPVKDEILRIAIGRYALASRLLRPQLLAQ